MKQCTLTGAHTTQTPDILTTASNI